MRALSKAWLALFLLLLVGQTDAQDALQTQYNDAMAAARTEGIPTLVKKLEALAGAYPAASLTPQLYETIHVIALLHPGSVPDRAARLQALKAQSAANPAIAKVAKRIGILEQYYAAALRGGAAGAAAALSDPALEGSVAGLQALADAALRTGDYDRAETLAARLTETDPFSPLIAGTYVILGLCNSYRGDALAAAKDFQRALAVSPLPTVYGRTQDYLFLQYRFARPAPGPVGEVFDEEVITPISGTQGLKDPRSLIFQDGTFTLIDRDQTLAVSVEGKVMETKASRRIDDVTSVGAGRYFYLSEDGVNLGSGTLTGLSWVSAGKPKTLGKLRSLAVDAGGNLFVLDQEGGLLRGTPSPGNSISMTPVAQTRGRLLRIDPRGYLYILATDQRSIMVYSKEGKPLITISPVSTGGREPSIEYFALDSLNHLYVLDSTSIQIFGVNDGGTGLQKVHISTVPLDQRPPHKNLRVIAVASDGTVSATGKNEDNWVLFR